MVFIQIEFWDFFRLFGLTAHSPKNADKLCLKDWFGENKIFYVSYLTKAVILHGQSKIMDRHERHETPQSVFHSCWVVEASSRVVNQQAAFSGNPLRKIINTCLYVRFDG
jgi:hypothetical protein